MTGTGSIKSNGGGADRGADSDSDVRHKMVGYGGIGAGGRIFINYT